MKLLLVFNQNFASVLRILKTSFDDVPELVEEFDRVNELLEQEASLKEIHDEFEHDVDAKMIERIFKSEDSVITDDTVNFMRRSNLKSVYLRMFPAEKEVLWKNLQGLCRCSSMLRACGDQLGDMEDMAVEFMKDHGDASPEEYQMKLFQEMLSGGEMSKKVLSTFQNPECIKNILSNVGNIVSGSGMGGLGDFANLMQTPFSDADLEEVSKGLSQGLPMSNEEKSEQVVEVTDEQ
jgi:hypothetical protein